MQLQEIISTIEAFAPLNLQESYDNAGLTYGNPEEDINGALLTIDITEAVIDEAISKGINLVISHHPLEIKGFKHIEPSLDRNRALIKAIQHNIAIYSAHTNIDAVKEGVSGKMAQLIGLENQKVMIQEKVSSSIGFGIIGELQEPIESTAFLNKLKDTFHCPIIRYTALCKKQIKKVALCGGSGASFIKDALLQEADIYISGDFKYHDFFQAENRIILADIGHFESEQFTKDIFYELLTKKLPKFAVQFSTVKTNPINYL